MRRSKRHWSGMVVCLLFLYKACILWQNAPTNPHPSIQAKKQAFYEANCIPRTREVQAKRLTRTQPLILYYTPYFGNQWGDLRKVLFQRFQGWGAEIRQGPPDCFHCATTLDRNLLEEADIVIFHYLEIGSELPEKYCGQYFVAFNLEAPPYFETFHNPQSWTDPQRSQDTWDNIDISMNYKLDSDVPVPYLSFWYEEFVEHALTLKLRVPLAQRDAHYPVAWIASKCKTQNNRIAYVSELMKYIGVKSYGRCLHNANFTSIANKTESKDEQAMRTMSKHKFYLAFENSNCAYYVTEKLTRSLEVGVIPIIMGPSDVQNYLPNNQSGINVNDFRSPRELAAFLHRINDDDALFASYFDYKTNPTRISHRFRKQWLDTKHRMCRLCDIARTKTPPSSLTGMSLENTCQSHPNPW